MMHFDWDSFTYDEAWLRQAVQVEVEQGCEPHVGQHYTALTIHPAQLQAQLLKVKLLSILFNELQALLQQADLGSGTEAAYTRGRQIIQAHLDHLSPQQQTYFEALVAESETTSGNYPLRSQLTQVLCNLLLPSDWEEIAQAAMDSIQSHLLQQVSLRLSA